MDGEPLRRLALRDRRRVRRGAVALERVGHLDQLALATERPAIDVRPMGGIAIRVHPRRGLDIGAAWFRGVPLAWIGAAGEGGGDAADWREAWGGGLVTTCGPGEERTTRIAITVEDVG